MCIHDFFHFGPKLHQLHTHQHLAIHIIYANTTLVFIICLSCTVVNYIYQMLLIYLHGLTRMVYVCNSIEHIHYKGYHMHACIYTLYMHIYMHACTYLYIIFQSLTVTRIKRPPQLYAFLKRLRLSTPHSLQYVPVLARPDVYRTVTLKRHAVFPPFFSQFLILCAFYMVFTPKKAENLSNPWTPHFDENAI